MSLILLLSLLSLNLAHAQEWKKFSLVNACYIMDMNGKTLKTFPGILCQFMDDGSYVSATLENVKYVDKNNAVLWEKPGQFHHQLNLSPDKKRILALSNSPIPGKKKAQDHLMVLDLKGNILHEAESLDYLKQLKREDHSYDLTEITHINSFYEIPEMDASLKLPDYIKAGNYILNDYHLGAFIVSQDLKKILHFFPMKSSVKNQTHDVQIMSNGKMLYFNNMVKNDAEISYSAIYETNLVTNEDHPLFMASPAEMFFSLFCGGAQRLDENHILFSHMMTGTYIYSIKEKKLLSNIYKTHFIMDRFLPSQQVKAYDVRKFLSHWK